MSSHTRGVPDMVKRDPEDPAIQEPLPAVKAYGPEPPKQNCCQAFSAKLFDSISDQFGRLGRYIGENPWRFVIIFTLLPLVASAGLSLVNQEGRPEELWVPNDSEASDDKDVVDAYFPQNSRRETVILATQDGSDIITVERFNAILGAYNQLAAVTAEYNGATLTWSSMCTVTGSYCTAYNALEPFNYVVPSTRASILSTINANPSGTARKLNMRSGHQIDATMVLGGVTTDTSNDITGAQAASLIFYVKNNKVRNSKGGWDTPDAEAWEKVWLEVAKGLSLAGINAYRFSARTRSDEFGAAIKADLVMINVAVCLLVIYCSFTIGRLRRMETRFSLTLLGIFSVAAASITGVVLANGLCGVNWTPVHSTLPFLLLGLGVDDMFVIASAYDNTNPADDIPTRMEASLKHSASAIMLTSLTDTLAFLFGGLTVLPALSAFCITAGVCIFFIFFYQVLLFAPFLALDERRRSQGRNDMFCCCRTCCCQCCICSGSGSSDHDDTTTVETTKPDGQVGDKTSASVAPNDEQQLKNCIGMRVALIRRLLTSLSGPWVAETRGNVIGCAMFVILFGAGIMGCIFLKVDGDQDRFIPSGSYAIDYNDANDKYFNTVGIPVGAYTMNPSYWQLSTQMNDLRTSIMANSHIVASSTSSWNYEFQAYMSTNSLSATTEDQWYTHLNTFLASNSGSQFRRDIKFTDNTADGSTSNPIAIARITANHYKYDDSADKVSAMDSFRDTVDSYISSLSGTAGTPFGYAYNYLTYEGYAVIELECYRNIGLAMACIMLVVVILIPDPVVSLLVFLSIAATIVEVCGFLHFWGLTIDSVTVILLVVSVGIAVDYAAHVGHAFVHYPGTAVERAQRAMTEMGTCVWHGFFSTFLAIIVLAPSKSYVFTTFFKELFMASTCGIFNGLLILPIFLKLFGRDSHSTVHRQSQHTPAVEMKTSAYESTEPNK